MAFSGLIPPAAQDKQLHDTVCNRLLAIQHAGVINVVVSAAMNRQQLAIQRGLESHAE